MLNSSAAVQLMVDNDKMAPLTMEPHLENVLDA